LFNPDTLKDFPSLWMDLPFVVQQHVMYEIDESGEGLKLVEAIFSDIHKVIGLILEALK